MNYKNHYDRLIERARKRTLEGYSERHHVLPRCMGGDNSSSNLVDLTPEEHYVAHQLLVKIHPGDHRLIWAAMNMTGANKKQPGRQNKIYGWLRRLFAKTVGDRSRGRKASAETKAKQSSVRLGKKRQPHSAETKAKMSAASKGRKKSAEHRAALSVAKAGKMLGPTSEEGRKKRREGILRSTRNPSGYHGVSWCEHMGKWKARITVGGKEHYLGLFATPEEASAAYKVAARKFYGEST